MNLFNLINEYKDLIEGYVIFPKKIPNKEIIELNISNYLIIKDYKEQSGYMLHKKYFDNFDDYYDDLSFICSLIYNKEGIQQSEKFLEYFVTELKKSNDISLENIYKITSILKTIKV